MRETEARPARDGVAPRPWPEAWRDGVTDKLRGYHNEKKYFPNVFLYMDVAL